MDENLELSEELGLEAFTHEDLEVEARKQAELALLENEVGVAEKRKRRENGKILSLEADLKKLDKLVNASFGANKAALLGERERIEAAIEVHRANIADIDGRLVQRAVKTSAAAAQKATGQRDGETRREYLIRKGVINPFSREETFGEGEVREEAPDLSFQNLRAPGFGPAASADPASKVVKRAKVSVTRSAATSSDEDAGPSTRKAPLPGLAKSNGAADDTAFRESAPLKRRRIGRDKGVVSLTDEEPKVPSRKPTPTPVPSPGPSGQKVAGFEGDYEPATREMRTRGSAPKPTEQSEESDEADLVDDDSDDYREEGEVVSEEEVDEEVEEVVAKPRSKKAKKRATDDDVLNLEELDDGHEEAYQSRIKAWCAERAAVRKEMGEELDENDEIPEWFKPSPSHPDLVVDGNFRVPGDIAQSLFDYQRTAVEWFWELHAKQHTGGILGDEMGLGKTVQTIAFLAALHYSQLLTKPVLVIAPATLLKQWCHEFHKWWPPMRVSILHSSGSGMMSIANDKNAEKTIEDNEEDDDLLEVLERSKPTKSDAATKKIVDKVKKKGHVLIATYSGLETYHKLLNIDWDCVILDEGHKIKNPDAKISLAAKRLRCSTRLILSGTPIQNDLRELWSLFDFIYPGKLGIYPVFKEHIQNPIKMGTHAGASNVEVHAAIKCATVLRELIEPYILRRLKADVAVLPPKQDQVLFCNLVKQQKDTYDAYLSSPEVQAILAGNREVLAGIDVLRKICNHPDLCNRAKLLADPNYAYGSAHKSGKMQIVKGLLKAWEKEGHKCLLFTQGVQMLDVLEKFMKKLGYNYLRMDGGTDVKNRHGLVDKFNSDPNVQVFILTTRVGGFGINLTSASRIIIFDPDWNPTNDQQARERAWRLGQKNEVRIYRLLCRGTIEEKIYHRQLYKQFLQKQILEDPEQNRVFKMEEVKDLFSYGVQDKDDGTETGRLFQGVERTLEEAKKIDEDEQSKRIEAMAGVEGLENFVEGPNDLLGGGAMDGGQKSDNIATEADASTGKKKSKEGQDKEDPILEAILQRAGVHSIVEHDRIISTSKSTLKIIEDAANQVAHRARHELKRSFDFVRKQADPASVTWASRNGKGGKAKGKDSGPIWKLRRHELEPAFREWMLEQKKNKVKVDSNMVMGYFNPRLTPNLVPQFKAVFQGNTVKNAQGYWELPRAGP